MEDKIFNVLEGRFKRELGFDRTEERILFSVETESLSLPSPKRRGKSLKRHISKVGLTGSFISVARFIGHRSRGGFFPRLVRMPHKWGNYKTFRAGTI